MIFHLCAIIVVMKKSDDKTILKISGYSFSDAFKRIAVSILILTILILPVILDPFPSGSYRIPRMQFLQMMVLLMMLLLAMFKATGGVFIRKRTYADLFVGVFFLTVCISGLVASEKGGSIVLIPEYLSLFILFLICGELLSNQTNMNTLIDAIILSAFVAAVIGILEVYGIEFWTWQINWGERVDGPFDDPNFFGGYLVMAIPLTISRIITVNKTSLKLAMSGMLIVIMSALFFSYSRSAWLCMALSLGIFMISVIILSFKKNPVFIKRTLIVVICSISLMWVAFHFVPAFNPENISIARRINTADSFMSEQGNVKISLWEIAFKMIRDRPFTGFGPGNYSLYHPVFRVHEGSDLIQSGLTYDVYNDYLELGAESGLPALIFYLLSISVFILIAAKKVISNSTEIHDRIILSGILCSGLSFIFHSTLFQFPMKNLPQYATFWILFAAVGSSAWNSKLSKLPLMKNIADSKIKYFSIKKTIPAFLIILLITGWFAYAERMLVCNNLFQDAAKYFEQKKYTSAYQASAKNAQICPAYRNEKMYIFAGNYLLQTGDCSGGRKIFEKGLSSYPYNYHLMQGAVKSFVCTGENNRARDMMSQLEKYYSYTKNN